tara:strand:+ start:110 stop:502 length:393 start_codon:yes stop_codon:yes gene_type:complete
MRFGIIPTIALTLFWLSIPLNLLYSQDEELDLDAMWENTIWDEIEEVTTKEYEVEKITTTAGVRGAEAEDEALNKLYYRKSMRKLTLVDLNKAYGKLKNRKDAMTKDGKDTKKIDKYLVALDYKIKSYKK